MVEPRAMGVYHSLTFCLEAAKPRSFEKAKGGVARRSKTACPALRVIDEPSLGMHAVDSRTRRRHLQRSLADSRFGSFLAASDVEA